MSTGWNTFIDVGLALTAIRDKRLSREEYDTFEDYCVRKWEYGRRHANRLIIAAQLVNHLGSIWPQNKAPRDSPLRPLIGLTPEQA